MAEQLQIQVFDAFLGTEEGVHSVLLPDIFSPSGSYNLYMDKIGRAKKIDGYTKQNSTVVTTNGGSAATKCVGLFPYRSSSAGVTTRQLMGIFDSGAGEWELWKSTNDGVNWTFVADLGNYSGNVPGFSQFGSDLFLVGGFSPRTWNGSTLSISGGTQSPKPAGTVSGAVGNLTGSYKYKIVSRETDGTRSPGSVASDAVHISGGQVTLVWAQDSNTEVGGYEVYRTTGTGTVYYFNTYLDGIATTAYADNTADTTLTENRALQEHGDAPPAVFHCEPHKGRMWWFNTATNPDRGWWSDPGDPDSVYAEHYFDFTDSDTQGDEVTGAMGNFGEQLVVFTERAVWTISGTGLLVNFVSDWNKDRRNAQTGAVGHTSIARIPAGARYVSQTGDVSITAERTLAYFTPLGDIRLFDGSNDLVISHPVKDTLGRFAYAARKTVHCLHDTSRSQVIWFIPVDGGDYPTIAVVWNYRWGAWYIWTPMPFLASTISENTADAEFMLVGGAAAGYVYKLFDGSSSFDGTNIDAQWMTKTIRGVVNVKNDLDMALSYQKRWRWADLLFKLDGDAQLTVEWLEPDAADDAAAIGSKVVSTASAQLYTSDGDTIRSAGADDVYVLLSLSQSKVKLIESDGRYTHDLGIRLRIGDNAADGSWAIEALGIAYQVLPGHKRRFQ